MHSCTVRCGPRRHDPQALYRWFSLDPYTCTSHRNAQLFYIVACAARAEGNSSVVGLVDVGIHVDVVIVKLTSISEALPTAAF